MRAKKNPELDVARNSGIYFAIGLNIMLFLSWRLLEFKTYDKDDVVVDVINMDNEIEEDIPIVNASTPPPPPPPAAIQENVTIVEDTKDIEETIIESTEVGQEDAIAEYVPNVDEVQVEKIEEEVNVPFSVIERVPIFPGCEGLSNAKAKDCFQEKMMAHVAKNFRYPEAALELQIQGRVSVIFTIDSSGKAVKIKSRGPDKVLEAEAERIISLLPQMKPGTQRGKPVNVAYALPVMFRIATQ
ncbi:energy transducer TonB [Gaetbulibacter aestuarii]|uniref:Energy transducer TonB n=1 Tax=Gaetbulibacter aestuarii TaxID=1502358 RepID=A0ABW7MXY5_9FLAO